MGTTSVSLTEKGKQKSCDIIGGWRTAGVKKTQENPDPDLDLDDA